MQRTGAAPARSVLVPTRPAAAFYCSPDWFVPPAESWHLWLAKPRCTDGHTDTTVAYLPAQHTDAAVVHPSTQNRNTTLVTQLRYTVTTYSCLPIFSTQKCAYNRSLSIYTTTNTYTRPGAVHLPDTEAHEDRAVTYPSLQHRNTQAYKSLLSNPDIFWTASAGRRPRAALCFVRQFCNKTNTDDLIVCVGSVQTVSLHRTNAG